MEELLHQYETVHNEIKVDSLHLQTNLLEAFQERDEALQTIKQLREEMRQ